MCRDNALSIIFSLVFMPGIAAVAIAEDLPDYADPVIWRSSVMAAEPSPRETAIAQLGKQLFFDPRLSADNTMSCASCHKPDKGWSDGEKSPLDRHGVRIGRATPGLLNLSEHTVFMWDGRSDNLVDQAALPITSPREMNMDLDALVLRLRNIPVYKTGFTALYDDGVTARNLQHAIAGFEKTLVSGDSVFSDWVAGDKQAMNAQQQLGFELFIDPQKGNCVVCHHPPGFTDNGFHNLGLVNLQQENADLGRFNIRPVAVLKGAFRTPGLKDIELTAPYFHDGSADSLDSVMDYYIKGGRHQSDVSPNFKPLDINQQEKQALVAFLKALTSRDAGR
ncbi:cytochrome-c peroxidase [Aliamphritea ceti]|uniref:cytochrome-c peroxidase n=1 Tax=Aliamphritea ceti TaxID=1524258 RepID=UPI0021C46302|nr:cytochrome c peroxidase [Aliamphritea ceti]